jgi:hypothetical protein
MAPWVNSKTNFTPQGEIGTIARWLPPLPVARGSCSLLDLEFSGSASELEAMNLWGPIGKLHRNGSAFYLKLAERFRDNAVVSQAWAAMAEDLDVQAGNLKALSPVFWKTLESKEKGLVEAITAVQESASPKTLQPTDWTLHRCLERTLEFEEQSSLKIYAPVIYYLRGQTGRALDFYVTVHAHLTRLARLIQPFSGDPALGRRCLELLERFEKEAQVPKPVAPPPPVRTKRAKLRKARPTRPAAKRLQRPAKRKRQRSESLVSDLKLRRRRARH